MHPARLLKSTPFRLALAFALLFIVSLLLAGAYTYLTMKHNLAERVDREILASFTAFQGLYQKDDTTDLLSAIDHLAQASRQHNRVYLAQSLSGSILAGNLKQAPRANGWATVRAPMLGISEPDLRLRIYAAPIGTLRVTVGASLEASAEILEAALVSFIWATLVVLAVAIAGGSLLAFREQRRIELIVGTMDAVGEGRLDARIAITRAGDDLDQLGVQINAALDRLTRLVDGMRQVSSDIAHDLKTPINSLYIALDTALDDAVQGKLDTARLSEALAAAEQINHTFDALLRITQIEAGARRSRFIELDFIPVLDTVFDAYEAVAEEHDDKLSLLLPPEGSIRVFGDRELLLQMVANLVENAIRHSPAGVPIQLLGVAATDVHGGGVVVSDAGPGIPAGEREKVFQRLYRVEKSRTTSGTGLGLSLVKAIADLHGASLTLDDNDPGLHVSILFPLQLNAPVA